MGQFCQGVDWKPYSGICGACGKALTGRNNWFCGGSIGNPCRTGWFQNHEWSEARKAVLKRDDHRCRRCGAGGMRVHLEVNHIDPRNGAGYGRGCWNHLDGLETLCRVCHVDVTTQQIRDRKQALSRQLVLEAQ